MSTQEPTVVDQVDALIRDIPNGWRLDHRALAESLDAAGLLRADSDPEMVTGVEIGWADEGDHVWLPGERTWMVNTDRMVYRPVLRGPWKDTR